MFILIYTRNGDGEKKLQVYIHSKLNGQHKYLRLFHKHKTIFNMWNRSMP